MIYLAAPHAPPFFQTIDDMVSTIAKIQASAEALASTWIMILSRGNHERIFIEETFGGPFVGPIVTTSLSIIDILSHPYQVVATNRGGMKITLNDDR